MKRDINIIYIQDFLIALRAINDNKDLTITDLHIKTGISYSYLYLIKNVLETKGWIRIIEDGKRKLLNVTDKGLQLLGILDMLLQQLEIPPDKINQYRLKRDTNREENDDNNNKGI